MVARSSVGRRAHAFTLIEMLIVITIIGLLLAIAMPVLRETRRAFNAFGCQHNMRQLAEALKRYAAEHQGIMPGNAYDDVKLRWLEVTGGPALADQTVKGVLGKYIEDNKRILFCPTFKGQDDLGGDKVALHYAVPTVLSGLPVGLLQDAWINLPTGQLKLRGIPFVVEPHVDKDDSGTVTNCLGTYDAGTETWTKLPDGAFEQDDQLACYRHTSGRDMTGRCHIAFHDGHVEVLSVPDPSPNDPAVDAVIRAQNIQFVLSSETGAKKTLHMGNEPASEPNKFGVWATRNN